MAIMSDSSTRHRGMLEKAGAVVLILLLEVASFASARFGVLDLGSASRKAMQRSEEQSRSFEVDLMHTLHVDSPYARPDLSDLETIALLVENSQRRLDFLAHKVSVAAGKGGSLGVQRTLASPIYSDQGAYLMQLTLGTPARTFVAYADTGSDLVWVQCSPCEQCFSQPDPLFDPSKSSSYTPISCGAALCEDLPPNGQSCSANNKCEYSYAYGDSSFTNGDLAYEDFTFTATDGSQKAFPNIGFGCGTDNGGSFRDADGLVGLGRGPLSLVLQLGPTFASVFSYCLLDFYSSKNDTSTLLLGSAGVDTLTYTPLIQSKVIPTFYYVGLTGITVAGKAVNYPSGTFDLHSDGTGGIILDSGTTFTFLFEPAYTPLKNAIAAIVPYPPGNGNDTGLDLCYSISGVRNPTFPQVVFNFPGLDLTLPSNNLFLEIDSAGTVCLAMLSTDVDSISIIGNIVQQNFQIAYDLGNNQVGFVPSVC